MPTEWEQIASLEAEVQAEKREMKELEDAKKTIQYGPQRPSDKQRKAQLKRASTAAKKELAKAEKKLRAAMKAAGLKPAKKKTAKKTAKKSAKKTAKRGSRKGGRKGGRKSKGSAKLKRLTTKGYIVSVRGNG